MLCLHKYRALGKLYGFLPREGHGLALSLLLKVTEEKMSQILDNSADAILFPLLYYLLYIGPVMQKGDLFLVLVQTDLAKISVLVGQVFKHSREMLNIYVGGHTLYAASRLIFTEKTSQSNMQCGKEAITS